MARRLNARRVLSKYGLRPKRGWSQNFLVDEAVLWAIAEAADVDADGVVVELGAGIGALSAILSRRARRVVAVERDRDLAWLLRQEFALVPSVEVLEENAAALDFAALARRLGDLPVVVGNLPYHMATPILFHLLDARAHLSHWVLMFQKELADRLVAGPGTKSYGVISVLTQRLVDTEPVLEVAPEAFFPAPKVHSRLLRFRPLERPRILVQDERLFEQVVRGAFSQRRKKLRNSLIATLGPLVGTEGVDQALAAAQVEAGLRPEAISLEVFARLADALFVMQQQGRRAGQ